MICNLCPRRCGVERTPDKAAGVCAMPAWPVAARAMLHQWEEPCLVGEHGAGAVFFSGCNLRCKFCQNGVISQEGYGKPITPQRLREIFEELVEQGAACLDLVTPLTSRTRCWRPWARSAGRCRWFGTAAGMSPWRP